MEKLVSFLKHRGVVPPRKDTYVIRLHLPSRMLQGSNYLSWEDVSFEHGLLADICRPLRVQLETRKDFVSPTVKVVYNSSKLDKEGALITEMKLTLLTNNNGTSQRAETTTTKNMTATQNGESTTMTASVSSLPYRPHVDSVNELEIEVYVTRSPSALILTSEQLPPSAMNGSRFADMKNYYLNSKLSDVSIKFGEVTYPAHTIVLSLHSPVFEAMFSSDTKEANERIVEVKDVDSKVMLEMLRYCYSEQVEKLDTYGRELYKLADRYLIDNLKLLCVNYLTEHVTVTNALGMYCFGREYGIQCLTEATKLCLIKNKKTLFKSPDDFERFAQTVPKEYALEIFQL